MERLTTNKNVSKMGMYELAHNSCYYKDGVARYRDFENDMDARDLARELAWSLTDLELSRDNECFDEEMIENLQYDIMKEPIGLIALFYRNMWAMADLRERLKEYEDLEEQGLLLRLPCKMGSTLYQPIDNQINEYYIIGLRFDITRNKFMYEVTYNIGLDWYNTTCDFEYINDVVFLTKEEAEQKLKEMESK